MNWFLALALYSNPTGHYIQEFKTEKECVSELKKFVEKIKQESNVKYVGCIPAKEFALDLE